MSTNDTTIRFGFNGKEVEEGLSGIQKWMERINQQNKALNESNRKMLNDFAAGFKGAGIAVAGYGYSVAKLIGAASNLEEVSSKFNVVFRGVSHDVESWVKDLQTNFNMSEAAARGFLASTQDLLKPMGIMPDKAALMSMEMTKLAADLGSFNNMKTADVMRDLQAATTGSFEVTKKYGVVINEAVVKQKAMSMALWNGTGEVSAAAKAQATLKLMMEGSVDAMGDVARTSNSFANIQKRMNAQFQDLAASVGKEVMPIAGDLLKVVTDLVKGFSELDPDLKKLIITIGLAGSATLVVTKIVTGFGVSFKKAIGPVAFVVAGLTTLIAAFSGSAVNIEQYKDKAASLSLSLKEMGQQFKKSDDIKTHLDGLSKLKEGSAQYKTRIQELMNLYPALRAQNITTGSSYLDVAKAVKETSEQMAAQARIMARKIQAEALGELTTGYNKLAQLQYMMSRSSGKELADLRDRYTVLEGSLTRISASYGHAGRLLGQSNKEIVGTIKTLNVEVTRIAKAEPVSFDLTKKSSNAVAKSINNITNAATTASNTIGKMSDAPALQKTAMQAQGANDALKKLSDGFESVLKAFRTDEQILAETQRIYTDIRTGMLQKFKQETTQVQQQLSDDVLKIIQHGLGKTKALETAHFAQQLKNAGQYANARKILAAAAAKAQEKIALDYKELMASLRTTDQVRLAQEQQFNTIRDSLIREFNAQAKDLTQQLSNDQVQIIRKGLGDELTEKVLANARALLLDKKYVEAREMLLLAAKKAQENILLNKSQKKGGDNDLMTEYNKQLAALGNFEAQKAAIQQQWAQIQTAASKQMGTVQTQQLEATYKDRMSIIMKGLGEETAAQTAALATRLAAEGKFSELSLLLNTQAAKARDKISKDQAEKEKERYKEQLQNFEKFNTDLQAASAIFGKKFFEATKAVSIALAVVKGGEAVVSAYASGVKFGTPALGAIFAAAAAAATAAQIKNIINAKPPALEMGGIISPSAQGTLFRAGEKSKPEAIIPLRGRGLNELKAALGIEGGGRSIHVTVNIPGTILGDEIPDKVARGIDKAMLKLKRNGESKAI